MTKNIDKKIIARTAKALTSICVRDNTSLEDLHAGRSPTSKTGDYSDVKVIDGEGREIPWNELSRLNDDEMKIFMKEVVSNVYTFYALMQHRNFQKFLNYFTSAEQERWDAPELQEFWVKTLEEWDSIVERWG